MRYVNNIADLYIRYAGKVISEQMPELENAILNNMNVLGEADVPRTMQNQPDAVRIWAIEVALSSEAGKKLYDPILDGLRSAVRYDRTYFDKIVASLLPLLEKLTTGKTAELLAPDYLDMSDTRPVFDWEQVIRKKAVVYIGLDALSDSEVASAVGNSMFADLVSVAGHIYKHGMNAGLPGGNGTKNPVNLHCDEFNELMGDEFIPLINKGGGAGMQVTAYTQTSSDIEARTGSAAKTAQVQGNFNNMIMLRVREKPDGRVTDDPVVPGGNLYQNAGFRSSGYRRCHDRPGLHIQYPGSCWYCEGAFAGAGRYRDPAERTGLCSAGRGTVVENPYAPACN